MREIDIPCSECGTELAERVVFTADLPVETGWRGSVRVAECPSCGARYYPRQTVAQLAGRSSGTRPRGEG
ncbi:hypothetical protein [Halosimplex pelagicum]|uniref:Uncharacterized protein n=1 Tax=Halosimplex pelagicum TaxID=869886 RepID=A0A7D5T9A8_9EURY|nr:hypothetical protein [Halosimplex pelagicum]QLH81710.1 hypothetical protein HZS54_08760 [Halosimplex pelagicum]